jgi:hypothetical protein
MREVLAETAKSGCEIRVLTMDAENPAFASMLNPAVSAAAVALQGPSLTEARSWFRSAVGDAPRSGVRALRNGMLFQQIIISDDQALVSPYLYSATTGYSPCLQIKESCPVFGAFLREFDELWKGNAPS